MLGALGGGGGEMHWKLCRIASIAYSRVCCSASCFCLRRHAALQVATRWDGIKKAQLQVKSSLEPIQVCAVTLPKHCNA